MLRQSYHVEGQQSVAPPTASGTLSVEVLFEKEYLRSINADSGSLFTDREIEAGEDLLQSIIDRTLTALGDRMLRPEYGTTVDERFSQPWDLTGESIRQSLLGDERITRVEYFLEAARGLVVRVNGTMEIVV